MPYTTAEIDLNAVRGNLRAVKSKLGPTVRVLAVVKANAYGHGATQVAAAAVEAGADMLGVARIEEAIELREAGIEAPILILGVSSSEEAAEIVANDVISTVCEPGFARALSAAASAAGKTALVHVKVDTGMGRIGVVPDRAVALVRELAGMPGIAVQGIFTQFPSADERSRDFTAGQIDSFSALLQKLDAEGLRPRIAHAANSAATLDYPNSHIDMVRVGLLMYGCYPSVTVNRSVDVTPVLKFKTGIVFIKEIDEGHGVSYGRTFRASRRTKVATIPVGYADGFLRRLSNRGHALAHGRRVPVIGRVCMDQTMLDVTEIPNVRVGDEVVLYGSQGDERISVEEVARLVDTAPHDVFCALGQRVRRVYL